MFCIFHVYIMENVCRVVEERKPDFDAAFSIKCIKTVIPSWHRKKIMSRSLQIAHFKTFFFVLSKNSSSFFLKS